MCSSDLACGFEYDNPVERCDGAFAETPPAPAAAAGFTRLAFADDFDYPDTSFIDTAGASGDPFVFLAVGTSGLVYPTAAFVDAADLVILDNRSCLFDPEGEKDASAWQPAQEWLQKHKPDIAIVVYNDHGLNFFLDKVPTFAIGCADTYYNADEGWALKPVAPFKGHVPFSWHIAEKLVDQEFDICTCQEMKVDHGFVNPIRALYGTHDVWPVTTIPLAVNTVQHPVPTAARCYKLGQALRRAVESYEEDLKVVVFGTGGLSHQLQGERPADEQHGVLAVGGAQFGRVGHGIGWHRRRCRSCNLVDCPGACGRIRARSLLPRDR